MNKIDFLGIAVLSIVILVIIFFLSMFFAVLGWILNYFWLAIIVAVIVWYGLFRKRK